MAGFAAGDPIDHYHGDGESVAEPSTISDSGQDVTMSDIAPNPQISVELDHQHDDRISSETGGEQGYQEVHQSRTAENLRFQQQLDYTEDQPGARKVVWPVESRENHRYNVIQAQHDLLEAQARRAPASDTTLSATAYQAYPDVAQLSVNQTPRFLIPNSVDHGFSFETNVARSSALYHNFQHQQGTFVPLTSPTTGASVHSYPADSTVTIPRSSVHPYLADPTVTIPRSSVHPYPADPTVTVPRRASTSNTGTQSSEPYPADPTLTLPRRASSSNTATQSSQVAPLNNSPVRASVHPLHPFPAPAINPGSTTDSTAHRAGTRKILIPRLASSSTKVLRTSGLSAGSSATGPHSTSSPAFDPTNSASAADQIYSSWPPASTRSPFVGKVPAHGTYSRLPATRSNEGPFVNAPAPQLYQPVAETQQRLFFNSGFGSTNQQHTSAAPADQVVIRWAPVAVPAPASNIQAHSSHIPANTVGSNQTPTAGGASNPVFKSPFVRAPGSCVSPLRSFSPSSTFGSDRIPTDSVLSQWTSTLSLNPANSTPNSDPNSMARNSAATRASGGSSSRRVLAPAPIDRSSYARARSNAPIPPLPQSSAPLFPQLPVNNNSISQVPVQELATRLAAMARDEGLDQPTPPSQWRSDDTSEWIPEHVEPVLPPAPANPVGDHDVLRLFWNHTRTNGQYWPLSKAPRHAKSGGPILKETYGAMPNIANNVNTGRAWSADEDQIIFDGTLRGDGWPGVSRLFTIHGRSADEINDRIEALLGSTLPLWWTHAHREAQQAQRIKKHSGEEPLRPEEWEELAIWVSHNYQGINPRVFHYSRCTERLRKEVRALEDMDAQCLMRAARLFPMSQYKGEDFDEEMLLQEILEEKAEEASAAAAAAGLRVAECPLQ